MVKRIVFKVYGNFDWPGPDGAEDIRRSGQFYFYYFGDHEEKLAAAVQWIPGTPIDLLEDEDQLRNESKPSKDISELDSLELQAMRRGDAFNYSLKKPLQDGQSFQITGAKVFDQYKYNRAKEETVLDLRWPLASRFSYGDGRGSSSVFFGQQTGENSTTFGFRIALPTPTPHGMIDGKPVYVFPFRVRYGTAHSEADMEDGVPVADLAAGYDGTASDCKWIKIAEAGLESNILGKFGFSRRGGGDKYARFPRNKKDIKNNTHALWLRNEATYFEYALKRFANVSDKLQEILTLPGKFGVRGIPLEELESILPTGTATSSRMYFRSAFGHSLKNGRIDQGDIQSRESQSRNKFLRLACPVEPDERADLLLETGKTTTRSVRTGPLSRAKVYRVNWTRLDQVVAWDLSDEHLARFLNHGSLKGSLERSLPFLANRSGNGRVTPEHFLDPSDFGSRELTMKELFTRALCSFRLPRLGVAANEAGDDVHALPFASVNNLGKLHFALRGEVPISLEKRGFIEEEDVILKRANWSKFPFELGIYRYEASRKLEKRDANAGRLDFSLPGLENAASPAALTQFSAYLEATKGDPKTGWVQLDIGKAQKYEIFDSRLGGLRLGGDRVTLVKGRWRFRPATYIEAPVNPDDYRQYAADETDFEITLGIDRVEPVGIDRHRHRRDTADAPLLLPIDAPAIEADSERDWSPFEIDLREEIRRDADRHFTARIRDVKADQAKRRPYVVISRQPFSIAALTMEPLQSRGDEGDSNVATYDGDNRAWLFNMVDQRFHYRLPPQGIGESMDKPGRLEIVDDNKSDGKPFAEVVDDDPQISVPALRRRVVDYRLTAPAHLWVEPSDLERNFLLPEWAAYELFRQRGDFGVGTRLAGLRAEWIYGLAASIDPSREVGPARSARVAEIEMLLGQFPAAEKDSLTRSNPAKRWNNLLRLIAHRPERLEMWMPNPALDKAFEPTRFADGVRFALRDHAQFRDPFPMRDDEPGSEGKMDGHHPNLTRHGLAGGALWGLESSAFVREFLQRPESTGGTIERVALSPLGGDIDFRAEFLNGLLAIIAEVRSGRVQRQRVEIIGRIGVFWHRAKHVVIYERTTSPSAQFTPDGGLCDRTRRPAIRKVEEFIELLQPERSYPDAANADPMAAGFLKAVNFNSKVIHVDSTWSEDVGKDGWKIPLWSRLSAAQRPSVYPQPNIGFVLHSEGEESEPVTTQECFDPENLYFYSDAKAATSDTDQWLPVLSVDWTNLPPPTHAQQQSIDDRASENHARKPGAQRYPRGQRRFTWRLAPSSRRVRLNQGRGGKPIFARLATLTFSRATADVTSGEVKKFDTAMQSVSKALAKDPFEPVEKAMAEFRKAVERGDKQPVIDTAKTLQEALRDANYADLLGKDDDANAFKEFKELVRKAKQSPDKCQKMVDDFVGGVQRKRLIFLANLNEWKADVGTIIGGFEDLNTREEWIIKAVEEARKAIAPGLEGARADLGNARTQVEQARSIVTDMAADTRALIARAERELEEAHHAYDDNKPWSAARLEDCQRQLESARAGLIADIEASLADARQRLATETHGLAQRIGHATAAAVDAAARGEGGLLTQLGTTENAMQAVVNDAQEQVQKTVRNLIVACDKAEKAATKIGDEVLKKTVTEKLAVARLSIVSANSEFSKNCTALRQEILAGRKQLKGVVASTGQAASEVQTAITTGIATLDESIELLGDAAHQEVKEIIEASKAVAKKVTDVLSTNFAHFEFWAERPEMYLNRIKNKLQEALTDLNKLVKAGNGEIDTQLKTIADKIDDLNEQLKTEKVLDHISSAVIRPAFDRVVPVEDYDEWKGNVEKVAAILESVVGEIDTQLRRGDGTLQRELASLQADARKACEDLQAGINGIKKELDDIAGKVKTELEDFAKQFDTQKFKEALEDITKLHELVDAATYEFSELRKRTSKVRAQYDAYADRVIEEAGNIGGGGLAAAPNNLLRLWAAAASAPEMPNLDYTRDRLGYYYRELNSVIDTTPAEAFFARLGSELKAMGISLPFAQFDHKMVMLDPSSHDIGRIFNRFCGMDLSKMFKGSKLPASARDAIRLTHDLDEKAFRAWAQVDIDLPMPGRRSLFTIGPFKLDFVDMQLQGRVRLEASKDTNRIAQSGHARLVTTIDAVVSGQSMVQLQKVVLEFDRHGKLDVQIDPKNIRINPALRFVQDALTELFPDEVGGLQIIKKDGLPIGVEHVYSVPPISIMGGTSGISNLAISNRFSLLAFPDFVIANRFALSRPDMPFLFTIFVIGGSGYIFVDAEYRPFNEELAVTVEAAAGGSAALGFSLGPVNGSVYVSLSVALSYRKVIGRRGGGLTISLLLLIVGNVDVAGLARVNITLALRMYYRNSGQIDGLGTVSVSFRVTRWFKYRYRKNYRKTLRKGRSGGQQAISARKASGEKSRAHLMMEART